MCTGCLDAFPQHLERVDHDVADAFNPRRGDSLGKQVGIGILGGCPQQVAGDVDHPVVDLLGHAPVVAAQPGFKVHDGNAQLGSDGCTRHAGIHIADHHDGCRALALARRFVRDRAASLLGVRFAADPEVVSRLGQAQVAKEGVRHARVVMLTGMHYTGGAPGLAGERVVERRHLHEIGARGVLKGSLAGGMM